MVICSIIMIIMYLNSESFDQSSSLCMSFPRVSICEQVQQHSLKDGAYFVDKVSRNQDFGSFNDAYRNKENSITILRRFIAKLKRRIMSHDPCQLSPRDMSDHFPANPIVRYIIYLCLTFASIRRARVFRRRIIMYQPHLSQPEACGENDRR